MGLVSRAMRLAALVTAEQEQRAETEKAALQAQEECLTKGVTGFHDAGVSFRTVDLYGRSIAEDKLHIRLFVMLSEDNQALKKRIGQYRIIGLGDNRLTVRAIKRFMDGALGSHGAWLLEPYARPPGQHRLEHRVLWRSWQKARRIAMEDGFQLCTHAIGDRGNRETLDVYEEAFQAPHPDKKERRWRIEHAQHLNPADIPRFGQTRGHRLHAGHPLHIGRAVGDQAAGREDGPSEGAYVWRKLHGHRSGHRNGTDAPVEGVDPLPNFYALVTRRLQDGAYFFPDQRMSRLEALRAYTYNGAYAAFEEGIKGSLEPGKLADIVVLSGDILTMPAEEILKTRVLCTILGGKIVYQNPELAVEKGRVAGQQSEAACH